MMINASTAKKLSDDVNRYDVYTKIANAIKDATERGAYSCQVIIDEPCTKDSKRKYREILEELGYNVEIERHLEISYWSLDYYNISLKIRWDE